jgi:hypothetical protein
MTDITAIENNILKEQLSHEREMKNHYSKISEYSERDAEQSEERAVFYKEMNVELKYLIDTERTAYVNITNEHARVTEQDKATIKHFESVIAGYEMQLYESMVASEMDTVKYAKLESTIDKITLFGTIIILGLIICFILYNIQKAVLNKKPKIKKTKPLVVVKTGKKDSTKKDSETTPIVEDKKAPLKNTPVNEPKPINPKEPMTFSLFIDDIKRKKDIKRTLKLEALKAKTLMQKPGDIVEEISIEETNKALAGGVLKKLLKTIMQAKKPTPDKKTKETKPNPTGETESKNKPKTKPTASSSVSTPPKDNTRGRSNDKNNKDKSTPKSKDKK